MVTKLVSTLIEICEFFQKIGTELILTALAGLGAYGFWRLRKRPQLSLSTTWKHIPASPNLATASEFEISNEEGYRAEFTLTNSGESVIYLGKIEISPKEGRGVQVALSELRYNDAREGLTKKSIGFPDLLSPRQMFMFTHSFSKEEFQKMFEGQHFMTVTSARLHKLKIQAKP